MTETINNANAAASTLFLGYNGEWWDFLVIISVIAVALSATAGGVATIGSIVSHKREARAAEDELGKYKLETGKEIAEANARTKEAELALWELRLPRNVWYSEFKRILENVSPATAEVLYVNDCSDCFSVATEIMMFLGEHGLKWTITDFSQIQPRHAYPPLKALPAAMSVLAQSQGITVLVGADAGEKFDEDSAAGKLIKAIAARPPFAVVVGHPGDIKPDEPAQTGKMPNPLAVTGGNTTALPKGHVRVVVAPKL
jgi:hypothetical protein